MQSLHSCFSVYVNAFMSLFIFYYRKLKLYITRNAFVSLGFLLPNKTLFVSLLSVSVTEPAYKNCLNQILYIYRQKKSQFVRFPLFDETQFISVPFLSVCHSGHVQKLYKSESSYFVYLQLDILCHTKNHKTFNKSIIFIKVVFSNVIPSLF